MPDSTRVLKARFQLDTSDAAAGAKRIKVAMADVSADMSKAGGETRVFASTLRRDLATSTAASAQSIDKMRSRIDAMLADLEKTGRGSSAAAVQLRALRSRIDENAKSLGLASTATNTHTSLLSKFQSRLEGLGPVGARFSKTLEGLGVTESIFATGLLGVTAAAGVAAIKLGVDLAHAASDLNEQISRTGVVFGTAQGQIVRFAETADKNLGLSETAALSAASAFGGMFHNAGLSDEATAKMSVTLASLSGDLASFMNLQGGSEEAAQKLTMGLTGQLDVLRELGIFISDVDVVNEAMRLGLASSASQVTESEKVVARYNLILQQTSQAQGDFARTADGAANESRQVSAQFENLKAQLGAGVLPLFKVWLAVMSQVAQGLQETAHGIAVWNTAIQNSGTQVGMEIKQLEDWGGQLANLITNHQKAGTASANYGDAQAKATDVIKKAAQASKEQNDALQKTQELLLGTFDADLRFQQSQLDTKDAIDEATKAQKDLNDAIRAYGPHSQQAQAAAEALQRAQIGVQRAALDEAAASEAAARSHADLTGATYSARDSMVAERDQLQAVAATLAPGSALRVALDQYINKLSNEIPRNITTTVTLNTVSLSGRAGGNLAIEARASGGPVVPGQLYRVGEQGPEWLVMGRSGGYVIPNAGDSGGSGTTNNFNISGTGMNPDQVAMAVNRRIARSITT